ncbi:hypothetical protein [Cellulophaga sp. BC115SP]|uniref:hypothetical protein n=1 Tax=Cellulophaga sp. BC115SP TaxID=2683263 RepID=UPI0014125691|nr:hypothetical protein [Cellulophaga sp. BC115SP]NBB31599.1 hypothetical protein [Cellulophaga sp. BC115SP]
MNNCLLIDDSDDFRTLILLSELQEIKNVTFIAPNNQEECQIMIEPEKLLVAIIDLRLNEWFTDSFGINLDGVTINNGVQFAEHLYSRNPNIKIGVYSANSPALKEKLTFSKNRKDIKILAIDGESSTDVIKDFIIESIKNNSLSDNDDDLEANIIITKDIIPLTLQYPDLTSAQQLYYFTQALSIGNRGEDIWKAGNALWQVCINEDKFKNLKSPNMDTFILEFDSKNYNLIKIYDTNVNFDMSTSNFEIALERLEKVPRYKLLFELFIANSLVDKYLSGENQTSHVIKVLKKLSMIAQEEFQKKLFKKLISIGDSVISTEQKIKIRNTFHQNDMINILDIYEGHVIELKENYAIASLKSISAPEKKLIKKLDLELMKSYLLEQDSYFEYILFNGASPNSSGYQILLTN